MSVESLFLEYSVRKLEQFETRIGACLEKLTDEQIWARGGENENAVGNLAIHLAGNLGQWILGPLGGVPVERDRDGEFAARGGVGSRELAGKLRGIVEQTAGIIAGLNDEQLTRSYSIQDYQVSGLEAVYHVVEHFAQHTAQIIFATKMLTGADLEFYRHLRASSASTPAHTEQVP